MRRKVSRHPVMFWSLLAFCAFGNRSVGWGQGITVMDPAKARVDLPVPVPPSPVVVDHRKQLFADDWVIEQQEHLTRMLHPIRKHPDNPLFRAEMPWEKPCVLLYGSVMYDPDREEDRFRMWYLCFTPKYSEDYSERLEKSGRIAYAISRDGLHWDRPSLGLHDYEGSTDNNIVIPGPWGVASIRHDPRDPDPQQRYKAQVRYNGHRAYFSSDGIRWAEQRTPLDPFTLDNSAPLTTDSVRHRVVWKGATDLRAVVGKTVRLQFELSDTELYAFWTGEERRWTTPDTSTWTTTAQAE